MNKPLAGFEFDVFNCAAANMAKACALNGIFMRIASTAPQFVQPPPQKGEAVHDEWWWWLVAWPSYICMFFFANKYVCICALCCCARSTAANNCMHYLWFVRFSRSALTGEPSRVLHKIITLPCIFAQDDISSPLFHSKTHTQNMLFVCCCCCGSCRLPLQFFVRYDAV